VKSPVKGLPGVNANFIENQISEGHMQLPVEFVLGKRSSGGEFVGLQSGSIHQISGGETISRDIDIRFGFALFARSSFEEGSVMIDLLCACACAA
jgi:hypothetical protein